MPLLGTFLRLRPRLRKKQLVIDNVFRDCPLPDRYRTSASVIPSHEVVGERNSVGETEGTHSDKRTSLDGNYKMPKRLNCIVSSKDEDSDEGKNAGELRARKRLTATSTASELKRRFRCWRRRRGKQALLLLLALLLDTGQTGKD
jgi:hypothetical protein